MDDCSILFHDIEVELIPSGHRLEATDRMRVSPGKDGFFFFLNRDLTVEEIRVDDRDVSFDVRDEYDLDDYLPSYTRNRADRYGRAKLVRVTGSWEGQELHIEVRYSGVVFDSLAVPEFSRARIADETSGLIEERGAFLSEETFWYPYLEHCLSPFRLTVIAPAGYEAVSQGRKVAREERDGRVETVWESDHPGEAVYLILGKWEINSIAHGDVEVSTYFFPRSADLVESYLQASARYLAMYDDMIGPYPYAKFATVENFFPTGYGMPSFTLLGSRVIRLPFIVYTSLGHEVLHNWWGNGVFVDYDGGNWCEGLTSYLADHRYKQQKSEGAAIRYRKDLLRDFSVYVNAGNDMPVSSFMGRTTPATRAIGYGKVAMIFHQLKSLVGPETFEASLRRFYRRFLFERAGWNDIEDVFEEVTGGDLTWFFRQWVDRAGTPLLTLDGVHREETATGYETSFRLTQATDDGKLYRLLVPVMLETGRDTVRRVVELGVPEENFTIETAEAPRRLLVDQEYDLMRRLDHMEIEPTISLVMGDENALIVIPSSEPGDTADGYRGIAEILKGNQEEVRILPDEEVTESDIRSRSLFVIGPPGENQVAERFSSRLPEGFSIRQGEFELAGTKIGEPASVLVVIRNPFNSRKAVLLFCGSSVEETAAPAGKIIHYGNYGYLSFADGKALEKGMVEEGPNPMVFAF